MKTNAQHTLSILFQHIEIFFNLIDYYNVQSKTISEFQISVYESILQSYIRKKVADTHDQKRIASALSLDNLKQCNLLAYMNDAKGIFRIQNDLLSVIKNIDSTRLRELGQPDLDIIYAQIKTQYDYFVQQQGHYSHYNPEFMEHLDALMTIMQEIFSKIEHNVRALDGSAKRLSEIVDSHNFEKHSPTEQVKKAFAEITRIYQRNILPTLAFLTEEAMTKDSSAIYLIRKIREAFSQTTFYEEASAIATIEMRLLSFVEVITQIRRKLHQYVEMNQRQRALYNAIEQHYNELNSLIINQLDSKLTGKTLSSQHEFFHRATIFNQLISWSRSSLTKPLIELPSDLNTQEAYEYIRSNLKDVEAFQSKKHIPAKKIIDVREHILKRKRVERIKRLMHSFHATECDDLYLEIHRYLSDKLDQYSLKDIYDARAFLYKKYTITTTLKRNTIQYNEHELSYPIKKIVEKNQYEITR